MAFDLKQLISSQGLKPEYVNTKYMLTVEESTIEKLDAAQQFALGQIEGYTTSETFESLTGAVTMSTTTSEEDLAILPTGGY
jgi:hypothetical protein